MRSYINPELGPSIPKEEMLLFREKIKMTLPIIPAGVLIFLVLGTIYTGIATPTEAA